MLRRDFVKGLGGLFAAVAALWLPRGVVTSQDVEEVLDPTTPTALGVDELTVIDDVDVLPASLKHAQFGTMDGIRIIESTKPAEIKSWYDAETKYWYDAYAKPPISENKDSYWYEKYAMEKATAAMFPELELL